MSSRYAKDQQTNRKTNQQTQKSILSLYYFQPPNELSQQTNQALTQLFSTYHSYLKAYHQQTQL